MKLLYCQNCGDTVVPPPTTRLFRLCACSRHAVWWEDPGRGIIRVRDGVKNLTHTEWRPGCWLIGIHNQWLLMDTAGREAIDAALALTPSTYLFKTQGTIAVKFRPGETGDSAYAEDLPGHKQV